MPEPQTRTELLAAIDQEWSALAALLEPLTPQEIVAPGIMDDWSVKDLLAHLAAWEQLLLGWVRAGLRGEAPELPAPGYTWEQEPELNQAIYEKYRDLSLDEVLAFSHASHQETLGVVLGMSEAELFTPGVYAWTKQNTLCAYVDPCTASHYRWAREEIAKGLAAS